MNYLDEAFWREQFYDPQEVRDALAARLDKAHVLPTELLAEEAVRFILGKDPIGRGLPIYSPERQFHPGELIAFVGPTGLCGALVVHVGPSRSAPVAGTEIAYDPVFVRLSGTTEIKEYVSNSPHFPTRFSAPPSDGVPDAGRMLTPGQIVTKFAGTLLPAVGHALAGDSRFATFDGQEWSLRRLLWDLDDAMLRKVTGRLRESGKAPASELAGLIFDETPTVSANSVLVFSVSYSLWNDPGGRFAMARTGSGVTWMLSPAPRHFACTLDAGVIAGGHIRVSREFQKVVDFYGMGNVLDIEVYGGYPLRAIYDPVPKVLHGDDIRGWLEENIISPGQKVYLISPERAGLPLVLYTEYDLRQSEHPDAVTSAERPRLLLRHNIYRALSEAEEWLHYREISEVLAKWGIATKHQSVEAVLSSNRHVFCRREPARGLWGLTRWPSHVPPRPVNLRSLALTIGEEKWVHRVLSDASEPLCAREIIARLAEIFSVELALMRQLTVIDPSDSELHQLADGRWILGKWLPEWRERLNQSEKLLARCVELRERASEVTPELQSCRSKLGELEEARLRESAKEEELSAKAAQIEERVARLHAELSALSADMRPCESEVTALEARRRQLARWRMIPLFGFALGAASLPFAGARPLGVAAILGSGAAWFALRSAGRSVFTALARDRGRLQGLAATSERRSGELRHESDLLRVARNDLAKSDERLARLAADMSQIRSRIGEVDAALAPLRGELEGLEEGKTLEDYARLRELLNLC
jgi:hypothetical protein